MPEPNFDAYYDRLLYEHLKDDDNFCMYCERPIPEGEMYCSSSCQEADWL